MDNNDMSYRISVKRRPLFSVVGGNQRGVGGLHSFVFMGLSTMQRRKEFHVCIVDLNLLCKEYLLCRNFHVHLANCITINLKEEVSQSAATTTNHINHKLFRPYCS